MRKILFATIAVAAGLAGIDPAAAAQRRGTIVSDGPYPLPEVHINRPGPRSVVGRQMPMRDRFDTRDYRRDPIYPDRGRYDGNGYSHDDDYAYEDDYRDDRSYDRSRVEYGDARDIEYDRDYPYDHPYGGYDSGGYGFGGYTMTETITTTTTPTLVKQIEYVDAPVAVHAPRRYKTTRRVQRIARRSIKGPRR